MKRATFIGFGALGNQLLTHLGHHDYEQVVVFDDTVEPSDQYERHPFESYMQEEFADCDFFVGIGYQHLPLRERIIAQLLDAGRSLPNIIHSTAHIDPTAKVGQGVYVYPMCNVDMGVELASGVLLNNSVVVSHDCVIGSSSYLSPRVVLSGKVQIGPRTFVGSASTVRDGVLVGKDCRIGMATSVMNDLADGVSCVGNPGKVVDKPIEL